MENVQTILDDQHEEIKRRDAILKRQMVAIKESERLAKDKAERIIEDAKRKAHEEANKILYVAQSQVEAITKKFKQTRSRVRKLEAKEEQVKKEYEVIIAEAETKANQIVITAEQSIENTKATENLTNFPKPGDNKDVSLKSSNYQEFDRDFAEMVARDHPKIWAKGGKVRGDEAFLLWGRARKGVKSETITKWIRDREVWASQHFQNKNVAGIVGAMKWGVIVSRGLDYMKRTIREEIGAN